jgi:hypothetical protein
MQQTMKVKRFETTTSWYSELIALGSMFQENPLLVLLEAEVSSC